MHVFFRNTKKYIITPLLISIIVASTFSIGYIAYKKNQTRKIIRIKTPNGVESLEKINIGGVDQWISIRGKDKNNPILLFLHGGPGFPEMPQFRHYNSGLESFFVIVNWDQRGAGKSFSKNISQGSMNIEQFVKDTLELAQELRDRFHKDKIYLLGHSWGSIIGLLSVQKKPESFHAYIGVGQVVTPSRGEQISYQYTLELARKLKNKKAIRELEEIGPPPFTPSEVGKQRYWLFKFGGVDANERDFNSYFFNIAKQFLFAPEYSLSDALKIVSGNSRSVALLWNEIQSINLAKDVTSLNVPVYFMVGKHDYNTPFELVDQYYKNINVPKKELIWFEQSAHSPLFEEPQKFNEVIIKRLISATNP